MAEDERYNGWRNYETWQCTLWIGNDEGMYRDTRGMTRDEVREYIEYTLMGDEPPASLLLDILMGWMSAVDWDEVAESLAD